MTSRRAIPARIVATVLTLASFAGALGACDEGMEAPNATPTARPIPALTATPTAMRGELPPRWQEFRAFAGQIEVALGASDAGFFASRGLESVTTCLAQPDTPVYDPCYDEPAGKVLRGVRFFDYTMKLYLLAPDVYATSLREWFARAKADSSDEFGAGAVVLYALEFRREDYMAIVTGIFPNGRRESRRFNFQFLDGEWRLTLDELGGLIVVPLDYYEACESTRDDCERWEGSAP